MSKQGFIRSLINYDNKFYLFATGILTTTTSPFFAATSYWILKYGYNIMNNPTYSNIHFGIPMYLDSFYCLGVSVVLATISVMLVKGFVDEWNVFQKYRNEKVP